jgi:hypothetical protein
MRLAAIICSLLLWFQVNGQGCSVGAYCNNCWSECGDCINCQQGGIPIDDDRCKRCNSCIPCIVCIPCPPIRTCPANTCCRPSVNPTSFPPDIQQLLKSPQSTSARESYVESYNRALVENFPISYQRQGLVKGKRSIEKAVQVSVQSIFVGSALSVISGSALPLVVVGGALVLGIGAAIYYSPFREKIERITNLDYLSCVAEPQQERRVGVNSTLSFNLVLSNNILYGAWISDGELQQGTEQSFQSLVDELNLIFENATGSLNNTVRISSMNLSISFGGEAIPSTTVEPTTVPTTSAPSTTVQPSVALTTTMPTTIDVTTTVVPTSLEPMTASPTSPLLSCQASLYSTCNPELALPCCDRSARCARHAKSNSCNTGGSLTDIFVEFSEWLCIPRQN